MEALEDRTVPAGTISVAAVGTAAEGGSGSPLFRFTRTGDLSAGAFGGVTIGGTASYFTDYSLMSLLWFSPDQATFDLSLSVTDDSTYEGDETVTVSGIWLTGGDGYTVDGSGTAEFVIADNDPAPPVVAVADVWDAVEGGAWGIFRFQRIGDATASLNFAYTVATSGTAVATPGTDYTTLSGSAAFAAHESFVDVEVEALLDSNTDSGETVTVTVASGTGYDVSEEMDEATVMISDPAPTVVSVARLFDAAEGSTGQFAFSRTGDTSNALVVTYTVQTVGPGLATAGVDYTALSGTVTIPAGSANAVVSVAALTDSTTEYGEAVTVIISTSTSYGIDAGAATVYITDDPVVVTIYSHPSSVNEGESGEIVLKRTGGDLSLAFTVSLNISVGGDDNLVWVGDFLVSDVDGPYAYSEWNTVTFPAGEDEVVLTLDAMLDNESDDGEVIEISLDTGSSSYAAGAVSAVSVLLNNVIPNITVPVQAGTPLQESELLQLRAYLRRLSSGKPEDRLENFTTAQRQDLDRLIDRFNRFGLQSQEQQRLAQLQDLLGALSNVPGPVGTALGIYETMTGSIVGQIGRIDETRYQHFRREMKGLTGAAGARQYEEIVGPTFRSEVAVRYWIRYQAEMLRTRGAR